MIRHVAPLYAVNIVFCVSIGQHLFFACQIYLQAYLVRWCISLVCVKQWWSKKFRVSGWYISVLWRCWKGIQPPLKT